MSAYAYTRQDISTVTETDNRVLEDVDGVVSDYRLGDIGEAASVNITSPEAFKLGETALSTSNNNLAQLLKFTGETLNTSNQGLVDLAKQSQLSGGQVLNTALAKVAEANESEGKSTVKSIVVLVGIIAAVVGFIFWTRSR